MRGNYRRSLTCTKILSFCAAHRLIGHEGACANLHGHNYSVHVTVSATDVRGPELDRVGRILDFSEIKEHLQGWLNHNWDHAVIVNSDDHSLVDFLESEGQKYFVLTGNATAEIMARYLQDRFDEFLGFPLTVSSVTIYETPTGFATCSVEVS